MFESYLCKIGKKPLKNQDLNYCIYGFIFQVGTKQRTEKMSILPAAIFMQME